MKYLDANDGIKTFVYEPISIPYVSNVRTGKVRKYRPDFLVKLTDDKLVLVEIKPSRRLVHRTNVKKFLAAGDWCRANNVQFSIITEIELRAMGLL